MSEINQVSGMRQSAGSQNKPGTTSKEKITFIHTADIHFGVENYGRIDQKTGIHTRLTDFERALSLCIDDALTQKVDFFLFSGDAYKTAYPTPTQQKLLLGQLMRLEEHGIPVVIIVGNHDHPLSFGRAHALDVFRNIRRDNFHVFSRPESRVIKTKSGPVQIVGIPWPMRNNVLAKEDHRLKSSVEITQYLSQQVGKIITKSAQKLDKTIPAVLAGHLTVSSGIFSGSEKCAVFGTDPIFLPSQLAQEPFDYVALGHLHRYQDLNKKGEIPVVYSGSIERVDFGERKEPKGYCVVTINRDKSLIDGRRSHHQFVKLPARPMKQIEVEIDKKTLDQTEQVLAEIKKHDLTDAIIKVIYYLPEGVGDKVDLQRVQRACRDAHYITGITPVHAVITRTQRARVSTSMSSEQLLKKYFATQSYDEQTKERLQKKAEELIADFEAESERGDESHE